MGRLDTTVGIFPHKDNLNRIRSKFIMPHLRAETLTAIRVYMDQEHRCGYASSAE
jgi:hypothetical protein